ncbi:PucR family transcriptional regulator [Pseudonocardia spinosispora]|uniref:PucR family transcriptional regulator n=1 Tax=Pseudonocardia spinosispora TaxID=103441 RepID=UPI00041003E0|nr:PucR family transcriptional regulator [Pseudonocardia spinosispora]
MSLVDERTRHVDEQVTSLLIAEPARLRDLLSGSGRRGFHFAAAPRGLDREVRGVTIWDPLTPDPLRTGDLVLATTPGMSPEMVGRVLGEAESAGASGVLVKGIEDLAAARAVAERAGVALVVADDELCWDDICLMARSVIPAARAGRSAGAGWSGGLFELAETAAALLCAPVEIADAELRVLAFANLDHPVDRLRTESIMSRRTPEYARAWLAASGVLGRLRYGRRPELVSLPDTAPRLVAPVVVRDAVVGYVSVAQADRPLGSADLPVVVDLAHAVASRMMNAPEPGRHEDLVLGDLFRGVLLGRGALDVLVERLAERTRGTVVGDWCVAGFAPRSRREVLDQNDSVVASCARLLCGGATATVLDGRVMVLLPYTGTAEVGRLVELLRSRYSAQLGTQLVACIGEPFRTLREPMTLVRRMSRGLAVLGAGSGVEVSTLAELRPRMLIAELGEVALHYPSLVRGVLDVLRDTDSVRNREYLDSLLGYFDAGCDVSEAAKRLGIHRNTLYYRLRRVETLCGFELDNPMDRFTVELQVRVHFITATRAQLL